MTSELNLVSGKEVFGVFVSQSQKQIKFMTVTFSGSPRPKGLAMTEFR